MAAVSMALRAWWARLRRPYVNARLERAWRTYDSHVEAKRGCRRFEPDADIVTSDDVTQPLPLVDSRPLMTPAARVRARRAERRTR